VAAIVIAPSTITLTVGRSAPLQARPEDAAGKLVTGATVYWTSSDTAVARVSSVGVVTARGTGSAQIAASAGGHSAFATVAVVEVPVASVALVPDSATVAIGQAVALRAIAYDSAGNTLSGRTVAWATSQPGVATVNNQGTVTAVAPGTATITGTVSGHSGAATITVPAPPVATVRITPGTANLARRDTVTLTAHLLDANGDPIVGPSVVWSVMSQSTGDSGDGAVVTVAAMGPTQALVTSNHTRGIATVTATAQGKHGDAVITVR